MYVFTKKKYSKYSQFTDKIVLEDTMAQNMLEFVARCPVWYVHHHFINNYFKQNTDYCSRVRNPNKYFILNSIMLSANRAN